LLQFCCHSYLSRTLACRCVVSLCLLTDGSPSVLNTQGVARRRRLREHLEELKRAKQFRVEEAERQRQEAERRKAEEAVQLEWQRQRERERAQERARAAREQQLMYIEDVLVTDNRARSWEVKRMEHEDIRSFMREQHEIREKAELEERYQALEELYQTFEPFPHTLADENMRSLHGFLHADGGVGKIYQEVIETLSQSSSHRNRVEQATESVDRKRSTRYIRIFEGTDGRTADGDADTHLSHHSAVAGGEHGIALHSADEGVADHKYTWLRKSQHLPVRGTHHSPTKHSIRADVSAGLLPNPYDMQWSAVHTSSAQCFVRTSAETFRAPEAAARMRSMTSLGPILQPMQETSMFEALQKDVHNATHKPTTPTVAGRRQSASETDILRKFGSASFPVAVHAPMAAASQAQPSQSSPASPSRHTAVTDSFFDDSAVLDSAEGSAGAYPFQPPAPRGGDSTRFGTVVDLMSQTVQDDADMKHISFHPTQSLSSAGEPGTFTASFDSSLSVFRSLSPIQEEFNDVSQVAKQEKGRKKLKQLLSTSADMLAKADQKEWLQFLQTQRNATFASLSALDAKSQAEKLRQEKLTAPSGTAIPATSERPLSRSGTPGQLSEVRAKTLHVAQLKKELKELGIVDQSILDFRTRQLAKSASESVVRMQREKAMLREYVSSGAVLRDEYFLQAVQPGNRTTSSLEVSAEVKKFAAAIAEHVEHDGELKFPSVTSMETADSPPKPKPRSASGKTRPTPKGSLRFGGAHDAVDVFIDQGEELVEAKRKEPDVALDLGVRGLSRAASGAINTAVSSAKSNILRQTKAPPLKPVSPPSRATRDPQFGNFNSFASLSTLSGGLAPTVTNPLGVIRGSAALAVKDPVVVKHRNAIYKPNNSSTSAGHSHSGSQLGGSVKGELSKRGSALSKSVELYIHTPSQIQSRSRREGEEESLASSTELSADPHWQLQSPPAPQSRKSRGSVVSVGSASIILDEAGSV
jgi:hypothetical protein